MADIVLSIVLATIAWIIVWRWRRMPKPPGVFEPDTQLVTSQTGYQTGSLPEL
jgi:hypothetical protein